MYTLADFDDKDYKKLLGQFSRSRRGKAVDNFYHELKTLKSGYFISDDLKIKLDRWCETSPSGSWRASKAYARQIRDMILDRTRGGGEYVHDKIAHPPISVKIEEILHMPCEYNSDWNSFYGITRTRKLAMIGSHKGRVSALNPNSEAFFTFFSLANLDSWQQPKCLAQPIRTREEGYKLSASFFRTMREGWHSLWSKPKISKYNAKNHIPTLTDQMMRYSVLFFEHDIMSLMINPHRAFKNKAFKELSFLNISLKRGWSVFDAYIFLPSEKRCIFIESKLDSDIVHTVKWNGKIIKISQIARAMESAYLFTHHPDSNFHGWDYDYLFICSRQKYESELTDYSQIIPLIKDPNATVIKDEYRNLKMDSDPMKKSLFEDFLVTHHDHIHVLFWDQLFEVLEEIEPGFLTKYMENLRYKDRALYDTWYKRLKLASIPSKKA